MQATNDLDFLILKYSDLLVKKHSKLGILISNGEQERFELEVENCDFQVYNHLDEEKGWRKLPTCQI